jgi:hypothetical protein
MFFFNHISKTYYRGARKTVTNVYTLNKLSSDPLVDFKYTISVLCALRVLEGKSVLVNIYVKLILEIAFKCNDINTLHRASTVRYNIQNIIYIQQ